MKKPHPAVGPGKLTAAKEWANLPSRVRRGIIATIHCPTCLNHGDRCGFVKPAIAVLKAAARKPRKR